MQTAKKFLSLQQEAYGYLIKTDGPWIQLIFMSDKIIRIRASFDRQFDEESYILTQTAWADRFDSVLGEERRRIKPCLPQAEESDRAVIFKGKLFRLELLKEPFAFNLYDSEGRLLHQDLKGRAFVRDYKGRVSHYQVASRTGEGFYGFGEKAGALNKAGKRLRFACSDSIGYDSEETDGLYKHIPFVIKMNRQHRQAVGLFYHNSYEAFFDAANEISGYWATAPGVGYAYYSAEGGDLDLFYVIGPSFKEIVEGYTNLTGKSALMRRDALGYLGSTMYYTELDKECDKAILKFAEKNKDEDIPMSGFFLSSGYTAENGRRYVFWWNKERFPDPEQFFKAMSERGISVSPNIKPGVLTSHPYWKLFTEADAFVKDPENNEAMLGRWWGGEGAFFDFTNPKGRETWKRYLKEQLLLKGCTAVWNDNNEYDSITDHEARCDFEGKGALLARTKPLMANLMAKSSYEAQLEAQPNLRPYITTRAGAAGIQRYAQTWTGDNFTAWKTIKYNLAAILGSGLSGIAHTGGDIGGFFGPAPEGELLVRWVQSAVFYPRFSIHSANTDNTVTEPWMYPKLTAYIRDAIKLRYFFLPYLYSLNYQSHKTGAPIMRPLLYHFQEEESFDNEFEQFMLGDALMAAPVLEKGQKIKSVRFPAGSSWYSFYSGEFFAGGSVHNFEVSLESLPLFLRSDAFVSAEEEKRPGRLMLFHAPEGGSRYEHYEDDGFSQSYKEGSYRLTTFECRAGKEAFTYTLTREGRYESPVKELMMTIFYRKKAPIHLYKNGEKIDYFIDAGEFEQSCEGALYDNAMKALRLKIMLGNEEKLTLTVGLDDFDLIGNEIM
jgi:alpha-glucosidase